MITRFCLILPLVLISGLALASESQSKAEIYQQMNAEMQALSIKYSQQINDLSGEFMKKMGAAESAEERTALQQEFQEQVRAIQQKVEAETQAIQQKYLE